MKALFPALILFGLSATSSLHADTEFDEASGLIKAPGWQMVKAHCGACHSTKLVTAQRGDRDYWLNIIRWMQRTQNLWDIPEPIETQVLDYLAANYSESEWGRRPAISPILMPDTDSAPDAASGSE